MSLPWHATPEEIDAAFRTLAGRPAQPLDRARVADGTITTHAPVAARFAAWLALQRLAMPVGAGPMRDHLQEMFTAGRSPKTIRKYASAIITANRYRGGNVTWDELSDTLKGITALGYRPSRQARPILGPELQALVGAFLPNRAGDARDAAMLTLCWGVMMRRAELCGLDWWRLGQGTGYARLQDGGIVVVLTRSKTRQRAPQRLSIGPDDMPAAVDALERWSKLAKLKPGEPLFSSVHGRTIGQKRLWPEDFNRMLKRRVHALWVATGRIEEEADELAAATSGHSLRAGCITAMALAGVPEHEIRRRSRHVSAETVARYVRIAQQWHDSGLAAVGF